MTESGSDGGRTLDMDDPSDVVSYAGAFCTVMTGICDQTGSSVAAITVGSGDAPVDQFGSQCLSWTTSSISKYAYHVVPSVDAATQGVTAGANALATTDTDNGAAVTRSA